MVKLKIGDVFRYAKPYGIMPKEKDGYLNHFHVTHSKGNLILLDKGINPIAEIKAIDFNRRPAIVIRSSPHKIGSEETPWHDIFDVDNGHIRYYGDNKTPGSDPSKSNGNKILLSAFETYNTIDKRKNSIPLIFYKAVTRNNSAKGYLQFNGFGIITGIELITQYDRKLDRTFSNYAFDFQVFSLAGNHEEFNWEWINDRRNYKLTLDETLRNAPVSWCEWVKNGNKVLEKCRRRVSKLLVSSIKEQLPEKGSNEDQVLCEVYKYFDRKNARFEIVASAVTSKIIKDQVGQYKEGWITPKGSDGGIDFYGRLDVGIGFGKAKLIVLGQAKCESLQLPTNGKDIARTVARLRRGWVGVYVTTSFFSESVQREIIEDEYPIMLVNGKKLAETLIKIMHDEGYKDIQSLLYELDSRYDQMVKNRRPDELLFE